jgi:hypothetical protein
LEPHTLLLDGWALYLSVLAMKCCLGVPVPLGVGLNIVGIVAALTLAVPAAFDHTPNKRFQRTARKAA